MRRAVLALADVHCTGDAAAFAAAYRRELTGLGASLASPGFAPIASVATERADAAQQAFIADLVAKRAQEAAHA